MVSLTEASVVDVVLVGGGHSNVQVLEYFVGAVHAEENIRVTLISDYPVAYYSGMLPGCVANLYREDQVYIELEALCNWAGAHFIHGRVVRIDPDAKELFFIAAPENALSSPRTHQANQSNSSQDDASLNAAGQVAIGTAPRTQSRGKRQRCTSYVWSETSKSPSHSLRFHVLAIDIGSVTKGTFDIPGVKEYALTTRPISEFLEKIKHLDSRKPQSIAVVGGGPAGVELCMALCCRYNTAGEKIKMTLVDANPSVLGRDGWLVSLNASRALESHGVEVLPNSKVTLVDEQSITVERGDGKQPSVIPCDTVIWATGADAPPVVKDFGLDHDESGYILVNECLQAPKYPYIYAAGDCITFARRPLAKAGVYAVREGPIISQNLLRSCRSQPAIPYDPQNGHLALLLTGKHTALGSWKGLSMHGSLVWKLKDSIDTAFMQRFVPPVDEPICLSSHLVRIPPPVVVL